MLNRLAVAGLALRLSSTTAFAQQPGATVQSGAEREVLATFQRVTNAIRKNDGDALGRELGADYQYISFKGAVLDRTQMLATYRSGRTRADSLAVSDERVRIYRDVAIITFRRRQVTKFDGERTPADVRMTHVYARRKGRWELVSSQVTPVMS